MQFDNAGSWCVRSAHSGLQSWCVFVGSRSSSLHPFCGWLLFTYFVSGACMQVKWKRLLQCWNHFRSKVNIVAWVVSSYCVASFLVFQKGKYMWIRPMYLALLRMCLFSFSFLCYCDGEIPFRLLCSVSVVCFCYLGAPWPRTEYFMQFGLYVNNLVLWGWQVRFLGFFPVFFLPSSSSFSIFPDGLALDLVLDSFTMGHLSPYASTSSSLWLSFAVDFDTTLVLLQSRLFWSFGFACFLPCFPGAHWSYCYSSCVRRKR